MVRSSPNPLPETSSLHQLDFTFASKGAVEELHVVLLIIMRKGLKVMPIERVKSVIDFVVVMFPLCASGGFGMVD